MSGTNYLLYGQLLLSDRSDLPLLHASKASSGQPEARFIASKSPTSPPQGMLIHDLEDFAQGPRLCIYEEEPRAHYIIEYGLQGVMRGGRFDVFPQTGEIIYDPQTIQPNTLPQVFDRVVAPLFMLLSHASLVAFHGSAIQDRHGQAWCLLGDSGVGKSTTLCALLEQGAKAMSDDMILVDVSQGTILPQAPSLRLWRTELPQATHQESIWGQPKKHWFQLPATDGAKAPAPCAGVVMLRVDDGAPKAGVITSVPSSLGLVRELMAQTFDFSNPTSSWSERRFRHVVEWSKRGLCHQLRYAKSATKEPLHTEGLLERLEALT